jgi:hypothetical protein
MANSQVPTSQTYATQKVFVKSAEGKDFAGQVAFGSTVDVKSGSTLTVKSGGTLNTDVGSTNSFGGWSTVPTGSTFAVASGATFATAAGSKSTLAGVLTIPSGATLSVASGATLAFFGAAGLSTRSAGSSQAVATDAATTMALANEIRAQLVALGIIKGAA